MKKITLLLVVFGLLPLLKAQDNTENVTSGNWYRIAQNAGNRTNAEFTLRDDISSGGHSTLAFRVGISYNYKPGISFSVLNHNFFYQPTFTKVRVLSKSTYDPQYIEVYVVRSGSVNYSIYDNLQVSGWSGIDWTAGSVPSGYSITEFNVNNLFVIGDTKNQFTINRGGNVGIGTHSPSEKLEVAGTIRATEIKVEAQTADFVFESDYKLLELSEVENFIKSNKHLPDIPSAAEMEEQGVNLAEMNKLLLQKLEELTLYAIEQKEEVKSEKLKIERLEEERKKETEERKKMEERLSKIEALLIKK